MKLKPYKPIAPSMGWTAEFELPMLIAALEMLARNTGNIDAGDFAYDLRLTADFSGINPEWNADLNGSEVGVE